MPDWSYHLLFRPLFFSLPDRVSRKLALGFMNALYRFPDGRSFIRWLGQMKPPEELSLKLAGLELCAPVGITGEVDEDGLGIGPLSLMGVGFLDLGVVTLLPRAGEVNRDPVNECLLADDPWVNPGARRLADRLGKTKSQVPLLVRLGFAPDANEEQALKERICLIRMLSPWIGAFVLDSLGQGGWPLGVWIRHVRELAGECARHGKPLMVAVSAYDEPMKRRVLEPGSLPGVEGLVITDVQPGSPARIGEMESGRMVIEWLENARAELDIPIIASGGVHEPADALRLLDAGANMVQVNSGVVFFGAWSSGSMRLFCGVTLPCRRESRPCRPLAGCPVH